MNNKNRMRMLVLGVLTLAAFIPTFAQNNNGRDIPFIGPQPQPIQQEPVRKFDQTNPQQQQPITIINNWPELQKPEPRPRIIYMPSRPRVIPSEPAKKDTVYIVSQPAVQSSFLSENGIIWCLIVLGLLLFGVVGYLIGSPKRNCYGNCNGCRGWNCGSRDVNVQGHIDHGHNGIPTKVTHIHTHVHSGIPSEIALKTEMPPKVEEKPSEQKQ